MFIYNPRVRESQPRKNKKAARHTPNRPGKIET
jgi:hypothetical protein